MKKVTTLLLFLLGSLYTTAQTTLPITITDDGFILVRASLGDSVQGNFILDTGAGLTVVGQKILDQLGEAPEEDGIFTGFRHDGDRLDGLLYRIPELSVGEYRTTNVKVGLFPPLDDYGIDGLLSLQFFGDHAFTIDFESSQLIIHEERPDTDVTAIPLVIKQDRNISLDVFIPVCLNGTVEVLALLDTGHGYGPAIVHPYFMEHMDSSAEFEESTYTSPFSGKKSTDHIADVNSLGVCNGQDASVENTRVIFRSSLIYEGLIGSEFFKGKRVTIDVASGRIFLE